MASGMGRSDLNGPPRLTVCHRPAGDGGQYRHCIRLDVMGIA